MADFLADLEPIFRDVFDNPNLRLSRESNPSNVKGWDSFAHINLFLTIERRFGIKFSLEELTGLKNAGEMIDLVEQKVQSR